MPSLFIIYRPPPFTTPQIWKITDYKIKSPWTKMNNLLHDNAWGVRNWLIVITRWRSESRRNAPSTDSQWWERGRAEKRPRGTRRYELGDKRRLWSRVTMRDISGNSKEQGDGSIVVCVVKPTASAADIKVEPSEGVWSFEVVREDRLDDSG